MDSSNDNDADSYAASDAMGLQTIRGKRAGRNESRTEKKKRRTRRRVRKSLNDWISIRGRTNDEIALMHHDFKIRITV